MASERAMVEGFCGSISSFVLHRIGNRRAAGGLRAKKFHRFRLNKPERHQFAKRFVILVISEPPAIGTTMLSGSRQPSCSAIS